MKNLDSLNVTFMKIRRPPIRLRIYTVSGKKVTPVYFFITRANVGF